jgi:UDP-N-acetyl-2-amino-2-deoxyglucuronate dehydrogenase
MKTHRIALVGSGSIAEQHLNAILEIPHARMAGVYSRGESKAKALGERGKCRWTTDWRSLVADPEVDVVDIVTSSGSHAEITAAALQGGKHVLVEKPMAMNSADCDRLAALAKTKDRVLGVVSQRRFEAQHRAVKKALDAGAIGKLLLVEVSCPYYRTQAYYDSADWRGKRDSDGGALMNQAIHSVDLMLWFAGPARTVFGRQATQTHRMEAEDLALGIVTFESGAYGTIMASTSIQPGFLPALALYGEKGTIKLEGASIVHWTVPDLPRPELGAVQASAGVATPKLAGCEHHRLQIEDVLAAVETGRAPLVSADDGRRAVRFCEALYESGAGGRLVAL